MSEFGDRLLERLDKMLEEDRVVVVYDPREEFRPLFERDLEEVGGAGEGLVNTRVGERTAVLAESSGSLFDVKLAVEPIAAKDEPGRLIIYLPGVRRERLSSPLMELEEGGRVWEPVLRRLSREALQAFYTDAKIDEMLAPDSVSYDDVAGYLEQASRGEDGSILKAVLGSGSTEAIVVRWLASDEHDHELRERQAESELYRMLEGRLGLQIASDTSFEDARTATIRYLLTAEFRFDLDIEPERLSLLSMPEKKEHVDRVREVVDSLRRTHPEDYERLADEVEADLQLADLDLGPGSLGSTDTFRFEEAKLLGAALEQVAEKNFDDATEIVDGRAGSVWVDRSVGRQTQWEVCGLAATLGREIARVRGELKANRNGPQAWVEAYSSDGGWFEVDRIQRRLETLLARLPEEPQSPQALACVRQEYASLIQDMALGFTETLQGAGWTIPGPLHQTDIYSSVVDQTGARVAYFLVDAMRFEMGVELRDQLEGVDELDLRPAVAALPTITTVGMAALMPGASSGFSVVEEGGTIAAAVEGSPLKSLADRQAHLVGKVPDAVDLALSDLQQQAPEELAQTLGGARLVVVRSQEIDLGGEAGNDLVSRTVMDTVIGNIGRAVRKLADLGLEVFVITADHGHQYVQRKAEDMRTDAPKGEELALHRRCWVGRGGMTPPGAVRVSGTELGYDTDLSFVFPSGLGVFKAGGGLSYHHGGLSLQELVVPVLTCRAQAREEAVAGGLSVQLDEVPDAVTNRFFTVKMIATGDVLTTDPVRLRVTLLDGEQQVGEAKIAGGSDVEPEAGVITIEPGSEAGVVMMLGDDDCQGLRIIVQDVDTDAVLAQSEQIPVRLSV